MNEIVKYLKRMPKKLEMAADKVNPLIIDIEGLKELYPSTKHALRLIFSLIGDNDYSGPVISLSSHKERRTRKGKEPNDLIELFSPALRYGVGIYGDKDGELFFSVIDHSKAGEHGKKPKAESKIDKHEDALLVRDTFAIFLKEMGSKNVLLEGPNDEPYIVMRRFGSNPKIVAKSDEGDILGLLFKPAKGNTVHGKIDLIVREKRK
jgi:hypothetical protein